MSNLQLPEALARDLARALIATHDPAACTRCLDSLDDYVSAQLAGEAYAALLPEIVTHLDTCVDCSQSYALLYQVRLAEAAGMLPQPASIPAPDLRFLRSTLAELLAAAVQRVGAALRVQLSAPLLELLRATPPPMLPALRDSNETPLFTLELPTPDPAVERLLLAAYPDQPGFCQLQVSVWLPGRAWPQLAGVPIRVMGHNLNRQGVTDPWGEANFEQIALVDLPGLSVELTTEN